MLRLPLTVWRELDPQALPFPDGAFDGVVSAFGAALAPRPRRTAAELVRVVRPGGVVALAAWVPKGLPGRLDELLERPEGVRPPSDWGRQEVMTARLAAAARAASSCARGRSSCRIPTRRRSTPSWARRRANALRCDRLLASCNNVGRARRDRRALPASASAGGRC